MKTLQQHCAQGQLKAGDYIIETSKLLGQGSFGKIYKCYKLGNPEDVYCAKCINKMSIHFGRDFDNSSLENERKAFKTLREINNPNLVQVYELIEQDDKLIIIMELCDYDLDKEFQIARNGKYWLTQNEQINIIKQILNGAKQLFDKKIIHRDIKPQNVLVKIQNIENTQKKIYKISDFGFCKQLQSCYQLQNLTRVGTPTHCAPEVKLPSAFNAKSDIYSYGILFYQVLNKGSFPFQQNDRSINDFIQKIQQRPFKFEKPIDGEYGQMLMGLIEQMIAFKINDRISFEALFEHEIFIKSFPVQKESLFKLPADEITQSIKQVQSLQSQIKKQERVERIFKIQEIFYRKYQLCQSVASYLEKNIILNTSKSIAIQLLIQQIGFYQLSFAYAACHNLWCDIHPVFKEGNSNQMIKLLKIFKDYKSLSPTDRKFTEQQKNIQLAYHKEKKLIYINFQMLCQQIQTENIKNFFENSIINKLLQKRIPITELCQELSRRKQEQTNLEWYSKFSDDQKLNFNKICQIELNQFEILNYQIIDLNEIYKI